MRKVQWKSLRLSISLRSEQEFVYPSGFSRTERECAFLVLAFTSRGTAEHQPVRVVALLRVSDPRKDAEVFGGYTGATSMRCP